MPYPFVLNDKGSCRLCTAEDTAEESMIACTECDRWFHLKCAKLTRKPSPSECWLCRKCQQIKINQGRRKFSEPFRSFEEMVSQLIVSQQQHTKEFVKLMATNGGESAKKGVLKTFEDTTREGEFSNLENLNRLKQVLHGTAYKSVQQLMMEAENVPEIIKRLDELFGRPDLVYLELLSDLQKLRKDSRNIISDMTSALENMAAASSTLSVGGSNPTPRRRK
uniref:PHD-type domain-containing protein n=1 Tax=Anopheles funestus TaxID=62324 RepID=A0A182S0A7_ANOFN